MSHIQQAIELDPVSLLTNGLAAFFYLRARHYDDAITQAQRMLELEPKSPAAKDCLISAYRYKGMYQEMRDVMQKRLSAEGNKKAIAALNEGDAKEIIGRIERNQLKELKEAAARGEKINSL